VTNKVGIKNHPDFGWFLGFVFIQRLTWLLALSKVSKIVGDLPGFAHTI
jgi:hypothetical protein